MCAVGRGVKARLQIVDQERGGWGNIGVDDIVFTDRPAEPQLPLRERPDFGTHGLDGARRSRPGHGARIPARRSPAASDVRPAKRRSREKNRRGAVVQRFTARARAASIRSALPWSGTFPIYVCPETSSGRHYATRFPSAAGWRDIPGRESSSRSHEQTRLWRDTWYDSTLPYWFLDRTIANTSIAGHVHLPLAGQRPLLRLGRRRLLRGHLHARLALRPGRGAAVPAAGARPAREMADFGIAFDAETGLIGFRGEAHRNAAIDGQAGCILRAYREHQMSRRRTRSCGATGRGSASRWNS